MSRAPGRPHGGRRRGRLRIARAGARDAAGIAAVMRAAVRGLARGHHPARAIAAWSSLPPLYHAWAMTAGGETYLAAWRGPRLVGYAALRARELTALFVRPSASRQGVARALLRRVEREALRSGARTLRVKAALGAIPFYEATGFRGRRAVRVPLPGGGSLRARALAKRIG